VRQTLAIVLAEISRSGHLNDHSIGRSNQSISKINKRPGSIPQNATQLVTKKQVQNMIASNLQKVIEIKTTTFNSVLSNVSFTGSMTNLLNSLTRGDNATDQYQGNLIRPTLLRLRFYIATDQSYSAMRMICFQWADATVPTAAGVLVTTGTTSAPTSPILWVNHHKIHVLFDLGVCLKNRQAGDAKFYDITIKGDKMRTIQMQVGAANVAQMYGLFFLSISDDGVVNYPQIQLTSELRFTDA